MMLLLSIRWYDKQEDLIIYRRLVMLYFLIGLGLGSIFGFFISAIMFVASRK